MAITAGAMRDPVTFRHEVGHQALEEAFLHGPVSLEGRNEKVDIVTVQFASEKRREEKETERRLHFASEGTVDIQLRRWC